MKNDTGSLLTICLGCIIKTTAYQCYACSSDTDGCGEPFNPFAPNIYKTDVPKNGACTVCFTNYIFGLSVNDG